MLEICVRAVKWVWNSSKPCFFMTGFRTYIRILEVRIWIFLKHAFVSLGLESEYLLPVSVFSIISNSHVSLFTNTYLKAQVRKSFSKRISIHYPPTSRCHPALRSSQKEAGSEPGLGGMAGQSGSEPHRQSPTGAVNKSKGAWHPLVLCKRKKEKNC